MECRRKTRQACSRTLSHLRHRGYDVNFIRNHTDVDDKIIARAKEQGVDPLALSAFFVDALEEDLAALGLVPSPVATTAMQVASRVIVVAATARAGVASPSCTISALALRSSK
jgi:cysteinyl-tRNA synthetase